MLVLFFICYTGNASFISIGMCCLCLFFFIKLWVWQKIYSKFVKPWEMKNLPWNCEKGSEAVKFQRPVLGLFILTTHYINNIRKYVVNFSFKEEYNQRFLIIPWMCAISLQKGLNFHSLVINMSIFKLNSSSKNE